MAATEFSSAGEFSVGHLANDRLLEIIHCRRLTFQVLRRLKIAVAVFVFRQPMRKGIGQVDRHPSVFGARGGKLEVIEPTAEPPLLRLLIDGEPDPLWPRQVWFPRQGDSGGVVLDQALNMAHGKLGFPLGS